MQVKISIQYIENDLSYHVHKLSNTQNYMLLKILTSGVFLYVKYSQDFANFSLNILYLKKKGLQIDRHQSVT